MEIKTTDGRTKTNPGSRQPGHSKKPRLLFTVPALWHNGMVSQTLDLISRLAKTGKYNVCLHTWQPINEVGFDGKNLVHTTFGPKTTYRRWLPLRINRRVEFMAMRESLTQEAKKADIIFSSSECGSALQIPAKISKREKKLFVSVIHNNLFQSIPDYHPRHRIEQSLDLLSTADRVICVSQQLQEKIKSVIRSPHEKNQVVAVKNGVDLNEIMTKKSGAIQYEDSSKSESISKVLQSETPYLVGVGRVIKQKGFDLLIEAHLLARSSGCRPHKIIIVGEEPHENDTIYGELIMRHALEDHILFTGRCKNPIPLIARSAAFILPSRYEGYPLALTEAAALGKPCIAADCVSGPREILEQGKYGWLVEPESPEALAQAIGDFLQSPSELQAMGRQSFDDNERLSVNKTVEGYEEVIDELLS